MRKIHLLETTIATVAILLVLGLAVVVHPVFLALGFATSIGVIIEAVAHGRPHDVHRAVGH